MIHYTFSAKSDSVRILKIGQHLPKLWAIKYRVFFYETRCVVTMTLSRVVSEIFNVENVVTLKSGSKITQGH